MKKTGFIFLTVLAMFWLNSTALAEAYSIYEIQYTTDLNGESPLKGEIIDCLGGIVTHKYLGGWDKLTIQDPDFPLGWGAIQIRTSTNAFQDIEVGKWVTPTNVKVEEFEGSGTVLQYDWGDANNLNPSENSYPLPRPLLIDVNEIAAPVYQTNPDGWFIQSRNAEKYEAMLVRVRNVIVTEIGRGKEEDNYTLQSSENPNDPNFACWAADYMNEECEWDDYHRYVELDSHFCGVTGIIEHCKGYKNSYDWDYYQLITTKTDDFLVTQPADFDDDCDVDFSDYSYFAQYWLVECFSDANCIKADMIENGIVEVNDLEELVYHWLDGTN